MTKQHRRLVVLMLTVSALLVGCPRFAYIELHNFSNENVVAYMSGERMGLVEIERSLRFKAGSRSLELESPSQTWSYSFNIPHAGENGPFFDGTLRLVLNEDKSLMVLRRTEAPNKVDSADQPRGFPVFPNEPNQGFNRTPESSSAAKPVELSGGAG